MGSTRVHALETNRWAGGDEGNPVRGETMMTAQPRFDPGAYCSDAVALGHSKLLYSGRRRWTMLGFCSLAKAFEDSASAGDYDCLRAATVGIHGVGSSFAP